MDRAHIIGAILVLILASVGMSEARMSWQSSGYEWMKQCSGGEWARARYSAEASVYINGHMAVYPGPNSQRTRPYNVRPGERATVCVADSAVLNATPGGAWSGAGGTDDTPPIDFTESPLGTTCTGKSREFYTFTDYGSNYLSMSVQCATTEPTVRYDGVLSEPSFTFDTPEDDVNIRHEMEFECNFEAGMTHWGKWRTIARYFEPYDPHIYRTDSDRISYSVDVLEPLDNLLTTSAAVDKNSVEPGETFIITVNIENNVDVDIDLFDYMLEGGDDNALCNFTQRPGSVSPGSDVDAILVCLVPVDVDVERIDNLSVSFESDPYHACTGDDITTVLIPPVDVSSPAESICSDGIDNDGDGLIDCLDPDCCSDPACPAYASNEGANGGVCCANSLDDDGDGLIDGEDPDCLASLRCPMFTDWVSADSQHVPGCDFEAPDDNPPFTTCVRDDDKDGFYDQQCNKSGDTSIINLRVFDDWVLK